MRTPPTTSLLLTLALAFQACGDSPRRGADDTRDTAGTADTSDAEPSDSTSDEDLVEGDAIPPADTTDTAAPTDSTLLDAGPDGSAYLARCGSFFAARVLELQVERVPDFPSDCDSPLVDPIGRLKPGGAPLCNAGETPNACRQRLYDTPPNLDALGAGCWNESAPEGCLRGTFLPPCADGSDDCTEPEVVCQDGTRPMILREAASDGPSDVWLFHLGGEGGPCSGLTCWFSYKEFAITGKPEFSFAMSSLHPDGPSNAALGGSGILSANPALPYSKINRVRFERCTDGASDAIENVPVPNGVPAEFSANYPGLPIATTTATVPVWHRGFATWLAAFHHMTTPAGRDPDGDGQPDLPSLADARLVILSASSDASMWLTFSADAFAQELRKIAGENVDVRFMIDGNFPPSLDNEARYHPNVPENFDMLANPFSDTNLCELPDNGDGVDNEACSDANYRDGGRLRQGYEARNVRLDASCEAFHGVGAPECYDRNHTLFHHVSTPFLILADQEDNTISDGPPSYANDTSYLWDTPTPFRERVLDQSWNLFDSWTTASREEGPGSAGDMVLILPKTRRNDEPWGRATHVRFGKDEEMNAPMTVCNPAGEKIRTVTYNGLFAAWFNDSLPGFFVIEDARRSLPNGNRWVTGSDCRPSE